MLVVIGLIVGGIVIGRELIKQADIRKTLSEIEQINQAVLAFRLKYTAMPGDMVNATTVVDPSCTNNPSTIPGGGCNGNGNGLIDGGTNSHGGPEALQLFRHLAVQDMIPGSYTAEFTSAFWHQGLKRDENVMASSFHEQLSYMVRYQSIKRSSGAGFVTDFPGSHLVVLGFAREDVGYYLRTTDTSAGEHRVLTPIEAQAFDLKVDDGDPISGEVLAHTDNDGDGNYAYCHDNTSAYYINHSVYKGQKYCMLGFKAPY